MRLSPALLCAPEGRTGLWAPLNLAHGWKKGLAGWQEGSQSGGQNLDPTLPTLGYQQHAWRLLGAEAIIILLKPYFHTEYTQTAP